MYRRAVANGNGRFVKPRDRDRGALRVFFDLAFAMHKSVRESA